jgi:hypothetical protein
MGSFGPDTPLAEAWVATASGSAPHKSKSFFCILFRKIFSGRMPASGGKKRAVAWRIREVFEQGKSSWLMDARRGIFRTKEGDKFSNYTLSGLKEVGIFLQEW